MNRAILCLSALLMVGCSERRESVQSLQADVDILRAEWGWHHCDKGISLADTMACASNQVTTGAACLHVRRGVEVQLKPRHGE